ncbi:TPA: glutamate 5-kinase, partial [Neisseria meningitidis]
MKYKRIVFKVGTSSITHSDGSLSRGKIQTITRQLAALHHAGHELVLVSSGAVAAGFGALGFKKRPVKIADKQASAAVGQGLLMEEYTANLSSDGIVSAQILLSRADFADKRRYQNAGGALSVLLQRRAVPIINENDTVSVEELKIGDNDTLSAQVAAMIQADLLVLLTDIDGLYTGNPNSNPDAVRLDKIEHINHEIIEMAGGSGSANGTGGMLTKIKAATIAAESGVPVYICSSLKPDALAEAAEHQA